jgi:threonine/homoserine/homoserine lactone efflux protein
MIAILVGIVTGFLMSIPIGPINVWVINTKLKRGFSPAFSIALGAGLMDFLYFFVFLTGLSFVTFSPTFTTSLKFIGVLIIFLIGIKEIYASPPEIKPVQLKTRKRTLFGFAFLGMFIYVSNPTLLITMSGLAAFIKSLHLYPETIYSYIEVSVGLGIGSSLWFLFLIQVIKKFERKIKQSTLHRINKICGYLLVLLSLIMIVHFLKT